MKQHQNRLLSARPLPWTSPSSVKTGLKKVRPLKPVQPDHSLSSVLQRSSAVFETWRYLCEAGELGKVNRVLRVMLHTRWSTEAWSQVRVEFKRAVALRSEIRRAGWFN